MSVRDLTAADAHRLAALSSDATVDLRMDEATFRAFYDRTARVLRAYLARVTGDRHLADDLLQESFYRFLRAGADYESESHRRNALFHIATNLARDAHRRRRTRAAMALTHERSTVDRSAAGFDTTTDLSRAMAALRPRERAMLWLAYAEGASHKEIAAALGVRTGSIKLLLFRARRRLARLLRGDRS